MTMGVVAEIALILERSKSPASSWVPIWMMKPSVGVLDRPTGTLTLWPAWIFRSVR